jgi:phosphoserine phosphatase
MARRLPDNRRVLQNVLTLIAGSGGAPIDGAAGLARRALRGLGAELGAVDWLAPGIACDLHFGGLAAEQGEAAARAAVADALGPTAIDFVAQSSAGRRKKLLVADMESTIIENEMLEELAEFLGLREEVAEITRRAMNDELDFVAALKARVALLADMPVARLVEAGQRIRIMPGAPALVATMRAGGARTALVSGGFRFYTSEIRDRLGFDLDVANDLESDGERLAGRVREPIVTRETKLATLKSLAAELRIPLAATAAVGDGANDLPMLQAAGLGVAFRAKPAVAAQSRIRIEHADLTGLLYAQGYRAEEIVAPGAASR